MNLYLIISKWKKWSRCFFHFSSLFRTFAHKRIDGKDELQTYNGFDGSYDAAVM